MKKGLEKKKLKEDFSKKENLILQILIY